MESLSEVGGRLETGPTKTGARRTVTLPRFLAEMLGEHLARYPSPDRYVFIAAEGGPVRHRNFYRQHFRPAVSRAGLPEGLRFHDLRHTAASLFIAQGVNPKQLQDRLGHSTVRLSLDRYGHLFEGHDPALLDGLDTAYAAARDSRSTHGQVTPAPPGRRNRGRLGPLTCALVERTTGLEPATLTLAR